MMVRRSPGADLATLALSAAGLAVMAAQWGPIAAAGLLGPAVLAAASLAGLGGLALAGLLRPLGWIDDQGFHWREDVLSPARVVTWPELAGAQLTATHLVLVRQMGLPPVAIPRRCLNQRLIAIALSVRSMAGNT